MIATVKRKFWCPHKTNENCPLCLVPEPWNKTEGGAELVLLSENFVRSYSRIFRVNSRG